jgi:hypothetical protein
MDHDNTLEQVQTICHASAGAHHMYAHAVLETKRQLMQSLSQIDLTSVVASAQATDTVTVIHDYVQFGEKAHVQALPSTGEVIVLTVGTLVKMGLDIYELSLNDKLSQQEFWNKTMIIVTKHISIAGISLLTDYLVKTILFALQKVAVFVPILGGCMAGIYLSDQLASALSRYFDKNEYVYYGMFGAGLAISIGLSIAFPPIGIALFGSAAALFVTKKCFEWF